MTVDTRMESWPSEESNKASVHAAVQAARGPSGDAVARFDVRGDTVRNGLRVSFDEVDLVVAAEVAEPHGLSVPGSSRSFESNRPSHRPMPTFGLRSRYRSNAPRTGQLPLGM